MIAWEWLQQKTMKKQTKEGVYETTKRERERDFIFFYFFKL